MGGGWGGQCTCPDGEVYEVGDNIDHCATLACIGGTSGTCNKKDGSWSKNKVTCKKANVYETSAAGIGGWGGQCTCPDGAVYQVGDYIDHCATLACIGGTSGTCNKKDGSWSKNKVTCANVYETNAAGIGGWGGQCTC